MINRLKAELDYIEQHLPLGLKNNELFEDKGKERIRYLAAKSDFIICLQQYDGGGWFYVSPQLDNMLGYDIECSDESQNMKLPAVFDTSCCWTAYSNYRNHFDKTLNEDYTALLNLRCRNGSKLHLAFVSRALNGFSGSGTAIATVMASPALPFLPGSRHLKRQPTQSEMSRHLETFKNLEQEPADTMKFIARSMNIPQIAEKLGKSISMVDKYKKIIRDSFKVKNDVEIHTIYNAISRFGVRQ